MPRRSTFRPLHPDSAGTLVRLVRGTGRKYFVSRNGNVYHRDHVVVVNRVALLRPNARPLTPDFKGRRGRPRVHMCCPKGCREILWIVARAWGCDDFVEGTNPLRFAPSEYYQKRVEGQNKYDFRPENIGVRPTRNKRIRERWYAAKARFEKEAEWKWERALKRIRQKRAAR